MFHANTSCSYFLYGRWSNRILQLWEGIDYAWIKDLSLPIVSNVYLLEKVALYHIFCWIVKWIKFLLLYFGFFSSITLTIGLMQCLTVLFFIECLYTFSTLNVKSFYYLDKFYKHIYKELDFFYWPTTFDLFSVLIYIYLCVCAFTFMCFNYSLYVKIYILHWKSSFSFLYLLVHCDIDVD